MSLSVYYSVLDYNTRYHLFQEAESAIAASHKAKHEAEQLKSRIEAAVVDGSIGRVPRRPISMYESATAPVYYGRDSSAARRQSSTNVRYRFRWEA